MLIITLTGALYFSVQDCTTDQLAHLKARHMARQLQLLHRRVCGLNNAHVQSHIHVSEISTPQIWISATTGTFDTMTICSRPLNIVVVVHAFRGLAG
jgi:hypothetical protein